MRGGINGRRTGKPAEPVDTAQRQQGKGHDMTSLILTQSGTGAAARRARVALLAGVAALALSACDENGQMALFQGGGGAQQGADANRSVRLVERDVEAPDVFQVTEEGLWDGRPSLGGVWVAHPDVSEPERVIIRNTVNGNFVIGALFRREVDTPGPRVQVSSDAAGALGMLAGQPVALNVTALRREEVQDAAAPEDMADAGAEGVPPPSDVTESRLDPIASAAAAIDAAPQPAPAPVAAPTNPPLAPVAAPAPATRTSSLDKPFLQIGIFSVEANANRAATAMRNAGMVPQVKQQSSQGKTFWRVLVGPAGTAAERKALLDKIKQEGFTDAYAVTN
jgi:rare lipoprotein A